MKLKPALQIFFLLVVTCSNFLEGSTIVEEKGEQKYHIYLDILDNKLSALDIIIPERFHQGVCAEETDALGTIFFNKNDPQTNWPKMTEAITYRQYLNMDLTTTIYESCLSTRKAQVEDLLIDHNVVFNKENGILTATIFYDRPEVSYKYIKGPLVPSSKNEIIFIKAFKGFDQVITIQYIKRYDPSITPEEKSQIIEKAKNFLSQNLTVTTFQGKNKKPDENIKMVSITPDEFLKEMDIKSVAKKKR